MEKHIENIRILNHFTNYKGHLFVKTLCDLLNDAAEVQTEKYGVDVGTLNAQGITWMLHRLHLQLYKMPKANEEVMIETWPSGIDRLFALRDYRLLRPDGEELMRGTSEWMYIDLKRRRPLRVAENVVGMSTGHGIEKLQLTSVLDEKEFQNREFTGGRNFTATFDNIDFNGHVTQASYMRWITNSLSFEFQKKYVLTEVEVVYLHEIMPDSNICSSYCILEEGEKAVILHQVKNESGELSHCIAKTIWEKL